ncbi:MAG TPA: glycosyltransferase family 4 protein [Burkholderiales bacterium]|nr:glycosyltransferase family 4 protein [Burkholderiales bacterium]
MAAAEHSQLSARRKEPLRPKVCIVVASPMTLRTLIARHITALADRYELTAVANVKTGEERPVRGVNFVSLPIRREIAPLRDLVGFFLLLRFFARSSFSAVQSVTPKAGLLAMTAAMACRVPVRLHIFTGQVWATRTGMTRWILKLMDRIIARCATHILADSHSQRAFLISEHVVRADKCRVLGKGSIAGVDGSRFKPDATARAQLRGDLGLLEDDVVFVYIGRLHRDKGMLDLATAFSRISTTNQKLRLLVAGPDEHGTLDAMKAALGRAADRVHFLSFTAEPERYMAAGDVFCLPSYREGFGVVAIEAAACGLPTIGTKIYGVTDAIQDGVNGLLFEPGDVGALVDRMSRLARDPDLRVAMGRRAREKVLRDFPEDTITRELMQIYASAIG